MYLDYTGKHMAVNPIDTVIITWLLMTRKGVKKKLDNISKPFIQFC